VYFWPGIACLYLSFVDGTGQPVQLISSPRPSSEAYKDVIDPSMFENIVHTEIYKPKTEKQSPSKLPGKIMTGCVFKRADCQMFVCFLLYSC